MIKLSELSQNAGLTRSNLLADWMMLGFYAGLEHAKMDPSHYSKELEPVHDFMLR